MQLLRVHTSFVCRILTNTTTPLVKMADGFVSIWVHVRTCSSLACVFAVDFGEPTRTTTFGFSDHAMNVTLAVCDEVVPQ